MDDKGSRINKLAFGMFLLAVGGLILGGVIFYGVYNEIMETTILNKMLREGYVLTSDATATDQDIVSGKNAYVNGELVAGSLISFDTSDATADEMKILKGKTAYVDGQLIAGKIEMYSLSASIIPTTYAQQVDAGVYLTEDLIISGDSNLKPQNIREGIQIFGVIGTYTPEPKPETEGGGQ